jgi:hypothetical protein
MPFTLSLGAEASKLNNTVDLVPLMQIFDGHTPDPSTGRGDPPSLVTFPNEGTVAVHRHIDCGNWDAGL